MTTERKDGGPAFPPNAGWRDNDPDCRGLSMRDWFAGQALQAFMAWSLNQPPHGDGDNAQKAAKRYARAAYVVADAMLSERQKGGA
jgi:hypothetical protein